MLLMDGVPHGLAVCTVKWRRKPFFQDLAKNLL